MNHKFVEPAIVLKAYDLYLEFYQEIKRWPKPERYNLGRQCETMIIKIIRILTFASRSRDKKDKLSSANIELQILKNLIRLAQILKIVKFKKYIYLERQIIEIGQMLGSWIKSI